VSGDPELLARGLFFADRTEGHRVPQVGLGIGIDGTSSSYRKPPPKLGQHTGEVLCAWLGYDEGALEQLRRDKVV
jgi:crotonobetainyl-CoA:carnitine CoA-transferase CaiB-like acyl-CoA transferase